MSEKNIPGIYLIVEFDWPRPFTPEVGKNAQKLHQSLQNQTWIRETIVASGGLGEGPSSTWVFWLENYAALDRLLRDEANEIHQAYMAFFSSLPRVIDKVREETIFKS